MYANDQAQDSQSRRRTRSAARASAQGAGTPAEFLALQRSVGNAAVVRMLREADRSWARQRQQAGAASGHRQDAGQPAPAVQRSTVRDVLRTSGRPLDDATRTDMEARLGADFSDVRIHNEAAAKASAAEVGARAYTSGNHIVIGRGGSDRHTLAHELTHVVQQRRGPVSGTDNGAGLHVSDPSDRYEREAEANATRVMARTPEPRTTEGVRSADPATQRTTGAHAGEPSVQRVLDPSMQPGIGFNYQSESAGGAARVKAAWMRTDGSLVGAPPFQDAQGYDYIRQLKQTNFWINFHLVNEKAGGPGDARNLVPASKKDNSNYHSQFEDYLKKDVDDASSQGEQVFYGVELEYNTPSAGTARQMNFAPFFPTGLHVYHQRLSGGVWKSVHHGSSFRFQVPQVADPGQTVAVTALTPATLAAVAPTCENFNADELAFLQSLGGVRKTEFEGHIDDASGLGAAASVGWALDKVKFVGSHTSGRPSRAGATQSTISFAERIGDKAAQQLSSLIATGVVTL
ncbi:DUF4157 domain-containing protein [Streptomyces sp. NPDC050422]|uniref:eCIS core domain-containing protein n=1 Tax=Streptomyces sp. NPDC050422 TaxID=3365614 RepID=UPI0037A1F3E1